MTTSMPPATLEAVVAEVAADRLDARCRRGLRTARSSAPRSRSARRCGVAAQQDRITRVSGSSRRSWASTALPTKPEAPVSSSALPASRSCSVALAFLGQTRHRTTVSTNVSVDGASHGRILEAARGEFAQHGYAARLQDIAERAGLTHPTLLYHFELQGEALRRGDRAGDARLGGDDLGAPCRPAPVGFDRVAALVAAGMEFFADPPRLRRHLAARGDRGRRRASRSRWPSTCGRSWIAPSRSCEREVEAGRLRDARSRRADAARLRRGARRTSPTRASARALLGRSTR